METRRGYDPVLVEGREARIKAKMPVPRPVAMGILPTPNVDFDAALTVAWKAANSSPADVNGTNYVDISAAESAQTGEDEPSGEAGAGSPGTAAKKASSPGIAIGATGASGRNAGTGAGDGGLVPGSSPTSNGGASDVAGVATHGEEMDEQQPRQDGDGSPSDVGSSAPVIDPAAAGAGHAVWGEARTRGCYENVPGPKRRMRIYCFRSPPGEVEGWVPKTKKVWRKKKSEEEEGKGDKMEDGNGDGMKVDKVEGEKDGEAGKEEGADGEGEQVEEEVEEHEVSASCDFSRCLLVARVVAEVHLVKERPFSH